jgi:hypothetical protein
MAGHERPTIFGSQTRFITISKMPGAFHVLYCTLLLCFLVPLRGCFVAESRYEYIWQNAIWATVLQWREGGADRRRKEDGDLAEANV